MIPLTEQAEVASSIYKSVLEELPEDTELEKLEIVEDKETGKAELEIHTDTDGVQQEIDVSIGGN